jgi:hypothetical protein
VGRVDRYAGDYALGAAEGPWFFGIRLRMAAGAWRDYHESIHARLPFVHSCTADAAVQEDLRRADERQARAARNLVQSPSVRQGRGANTATHDAGALPQGSSYFLGQPRLRPRGPERCRRSGGATFKKAALLNQIG